jgi:hypothetical protein
MPHITLLLFASVLDLSFTGDFLMAMISANFWAPIIRYKSSLTEGAAGGD